MTSLRYFVKLQHSDIKISLEKGLLHRYVASELQQPHSNLNPCANDIPGRQPNLYVKCLLVALASFQGHGDSTAQKIK